MKIKILGSGAWEGIPAPMCKCRVCNSAQEDKNNKNNRTRPQLLVESEEKQFGIEISPDFRIQSSNPEVGQIKDFFISHWHFDHLYGLLELHAHVKFIEKINIYCSKDTADWIKRYFNHIPLNLIVINPFETIKLNGVKVTAIPVKHMSNVDSTKNEEELCNTFAFLLEKNNKKVVYLADYYSIPEKSRKFIEKCDLLIADGTYLFEEKFPNLSLQNNEKNDPDHIHGDEILRFVNSLNAKKVLFHSISHLSNMNHEEMTSHLQENHLLSYDGISFDFLIEVNEK
jgi:phosphoribosyl 1,2-cyclic phosphate phosphodiesterase